MVKPKKFLGQHFLKDELVASRTAHLTDRYEVKNWLEIGPGTGMLTQQLLNKKNLHLEAIELDRESVAYLKQSQPKLVVHEDDFLKFDLFSKLPAPLGIIGNFPYNISSQIVFKILNHTEEIPAFCGMFQLEVAQRLAASPGSKTYGILSVLTSAWYDVRIEFTIPPEAFFPPPKVQSAVISAQRHQREFNANKALFFDVVKTAFQQRRKMLSNALGKFNLPPPESELHQLLKLRAENLNVDQFVALTNFIAGKGE